MLKSDLSTTLNPQQADFLEAAPPQQAQVDARGEGSAVLSWGSDSFQFQEALRPGDFPKEGLQLSQAEELEGAGECLAPFEGIWIKVNHQGRGQWGRRHLFWSRTELAMNPSPPVLAVDQSASYTTSRSLALLYSAAKGDNNGADSTDQGDEAMFYRTAWAGAPGVVRPSAVDPEGRHPKTAHLKTCQPCVT